MCGIAGLISLDQNPLPENSDVAVRAMIAALAHRGPDDDGLWAEPSGMALFGHRRLSIIDPTPEAHQPMISDSKGSLTFNGEIYNFRELREEYQLNVPNSDTAVLLALLDRFGEKILPKLRGFFAFAYYNGRTRSALLARDAIGKKPICYATARDVLLFASEQRALMQSGLLTFKIDSVALAEYLRYYSVPHPLSLIEGVRTLPPGHLLYITEDGNMQEREWYSLPAYNPVSIQYDDAVRETRRLLEQSVRYRLVSDVPVGAFLSAGLDSNAIVALMSREVSEPIQTFTIGFDSGRQAASEVDLAGISARAFRTDHHEKRVTASNVLASLPEFFWHMDAPTGDGLNAFLVAKAARVAAPDLKVVLSGVGGDELFLGYRKYRWVAKRRRIISAIWSLPLSIRQSIARFANDDSRMAIALRTVMTPEAIRSLFNDSEIHRLTKTKDNHSSSIDSIEYLLQNDLQRYLPDTLLRDLDVMTMSQSLEARAPLLDRELVEFAWQLPTALKARGTSKQILADAVRDLLPREILDRPKTGFELPLREWLLNGELRPLLDLLRRGELRIIKEGLLEKSAVADIHRNFVSGSTHYLKPWTILALEFWYRSFRTDANYEDWCSGAWQTL